MMRDLFTRPNSEYRRDLNIVRDYVEDAARYLHIQTQQPLDTCRAWVRQQVGPKGKQPLKNPRVRYFQRERNGDRHIIEGTFLGYLKDAIGKSEIIAPTFTTYTSQKEQLSVYAKYIKQNKKRRAEFKSEMFLATMRGDRLAAAINDSLQNTQKIKNNALSGAFCSPSTPLYNKTGHSTLTSITRCITSYGNASNERFLQGNRHYWHPDLVIENIVSTINHVQLDRVQQTCERWGLVYPSTADVMSMVKRSTEYYWRDQRCFSEIRDFVDRLSPVERAAYLYSGDLYHLKLLNEDFVRTFITKLATKPQQALTPEETHPVIKSVSDNMLVHALILNYQEVDHRAFKDVKDNDAETYGLVGGTCVHIQTVLEEYEDILQSFWITDNLPGSVHSIGSMSRRTVLTSDTDSTIITAADWVEWFYGEPRADFSSMGATSALVFLAVEIIRHVLALMSGNMGVAEDYVKLLAMKNEFFFPVFAITGIKKTYYGYRSVQEGNVFKQMKQEIKGRALRDSNAPMEIIKDAQNQMLSVMDTVMAGNTLALGDYLNQVSQVEGEIVHHIEKGGIGIFRKSRINVKEAYKNVEQSNYIHYDMWQTVFAPKYGEVEPPPYRVLKVSVELDKPKLFQEWLDNLEDREFADRMTQWMSERGKNKISTFMLPQTALLQRGMPKELMSAIDTRKLLSDSMEAHYLILQSLGLEVKDHKLSRMVSDGLLN